MTQDLTPEQRLAAALVRVKKLEAELDNVKDFCLKLGQRMLHCELAVSAMAPNETILEILRPDPDRREHT